MRSSPLLGDAIDFCNLLLSTCAFQWNGNIHMSREFQFIVNNMFNCWIFVCENQLHCEDMGRESIRLHKIWEIKSLESCSSQVDDNDGWGSLTGKEIQSDKFLCIFGIHIF